MLTHLSVPTMETTMTFSVSRDAGAYEWSGASLSGVFAQRRNIWNPRTWRMLLDIIRFNLTAIELLSPTPQTKPKTKTKTSPSSSSSSSSSPQQSSSPAYQETLGHYLHRKSYSSAFINDYLLPMTAAVWSTPADKCALEFPAQTLVRFMWNHHLLSTLSARPAWLTIRGGSSTYIRAILKYFPGAEIHTSSPVRGVVGRPEGGSGGGNGKGGVFVDLGERGVMEFDHVIVATHGDQARQLLGTGATELEAEVLDCFTTIENVAVLHGDMSVIILPLLFSTSANDANTSCL